MTITLTPEQLIKGFFALFIGGFIAWVIFDRDELELRGDGGRQRYVPYIPGSILPWVLLSIVLLAAAYYGPVQAIQLTFDAFFGVALHIFAYNLLLLLLLPLLRRWFSARACAVLWMLPNYLYLNLQSYAQVAEPALVLRARGNWIWYLLAVWLAGFLAVLVWKTVAHLVFRRRILKDAETVTDSAVLTVWTEELAAARVKKPKFYLVYSPAVTTPLSIGLTLRSTRVVLPLRDYTEEELHLLLRHELVHIGRGDACNKFFMLFCTALGWFNPLMWIAMGKSADDLELSCDETVLLESDEAAKRQYARLLLNTAGDGRGFTTCLSASAATLRYRLKNVMNPKKKHCGALLVGLVFFLLFMSCGYVALAYDAGTGEELLFHGAPEDYSLMDYFTLGPDFLQYDRKTCDEAAVLDYISGLELYRLTGNYSFPDQREQRGFNYYFGTPAGVEVIRLQGNIAKVIPLHGKRPDTRTYYIPDGIDAAYLESLLN